MRALLIMISIWIDRYSDVCGNGGSVMDACNKRSSFAGTATSRSEFILSINPPATSPSAASAAMAVKELLDSNDGSAPSLSGTHRDSLTSSKGSLYSDDRSPTDQVSLRWDLSLSLSLSFSLSSCFSLKICWKFDENFFFEKFQSAFRAVSVPFSSLGAFFLVSEQFRCSFSAVSVQFHGLRGYLLFQGSFSAVL